MAKRGDKQSNITAYFGTNSGRINETIKRRHFSDVPAAPLNQLPPSGPPIVHAASIVNVQITGIAEEFVQAMRRVEAKVDQTQQQLAGFGRRIGLIEDPKFPLLTRRRPQES